MIVGAANYLIRFEDRVVSHRWLKQFFERNLEYYVHKQKFLSVDSKQNDSVHDMNDYFEKVERVIREKEITNLDLWNVDETRF